MPGEKKVVGERWSVLTIPIRAPSLIPLINARFILTSPPHFPPREKFVKDAITSFAEAVAGSSVIRRPPVGDTAAKQLLENYLFPHSNEIDKGHFMSSLLIFVVPLV
jgi:hypothetical protein